MTLILCILVYYILVIMPSQFIARPILEKMVSFYNISSKKDCWTIAIVFTLAWPAVLFHMKWKTKKSLLT